jgi:hypothetical protein
MGDGAVHNSDCEFDSHLFPHNIDRGVVMSKKVRVLRILEYVGSREWVEEALRKSHVPLNGDSSHYTGSNNMIKSAIIDVFPEILSDTDKDIQETLEVKDRVLIFNNNGEAVALGTIVNINHFREESQVYAVHVDTYDEDVLFYSKSQLQKVGR